MILLDTNVVSELMRRSPDPAVEVWVMGHAVEALFFSAVGRAELHYGAAILPAGRRFEPLGVGRGDAIGDLETSWSSQPSVPVIIAVNRRCISSGVTSARKWPTFQRWPEGSRNQPDRSP